MVSPSEQELNRLLERFEAQPEGRLFAPLADCYRKLGRLDDAFQLCVDGLARHPRYSSGFVILGKIHLNRGEDLDAQVAFETVLALDPDNLLALRELALLSESRGETAAALDYWQPLAQLDPGNEEVAEHIERLTGALVDQVTGEVAANASGGTAAVLTAVTIDDVMAKESRDEDPRDEQDDESVQAEVEPQTGPAEDSGQADESQDAGGELEEAPIPEQPSTPASAPSGGERTGKVATEIVTMTLADIYYEQGFKAKALEMYQAVYDRSPQTPGVAEKIQLIEGELAAIANQAQQMPDTNEASLEDLETGLDEASSDARDEAQPRPKGPPVEAQTVETPVEEMEQDAPVSRPVVDADASAEEGEDLDHFKNWLSKIKLRDS